MPLCLSFLREVRGRSIGSAFICRGSFGKHFGNVATILGEILICSYHNSHSSTSPQVCYSFFPHQPELSGFCKWICYERTMITFGWLKTLQLTENWWCLPTNLVYLGPLLNRVLSNALVHGSSTFSGTTEVRGNTWYKSMFALWASRCVCITVDFKKHLQG